VTARGKDLVVEEASGKVAVRWSADGTNALRYLGVGPTRQLTHITGIEIIEIKNDRIVRRWGEWDISEHLSRTALTFPFVSSI
jgi:predicted ester cyclase